MLEGMEEESEEAEEEVQDEEYDGYWSDEEDRAIFGQFVVEPLFDVSHMPKMPNKVPEHWLAVSGNEALTRSLLEQKDLEAHRLLQQSILPPSPALATVALNSRMQDKEMDSTEENNTDLIIPKANQNDQDQEIKLLNEKFLKYAMEAEAWRAKIETDSEAWRAKIETKMAAENQELRQKLEVMEKKMEMLDQGERDQDGRNKLGH